MHSLFVPGILYLILPELGIAIIVDVTVVMALIKQQRIPIDTLFILSLSIRIMVIFVLASGYLSFDGYWAGKAGNNGLV